MLGETVVVLHRRRVSDDPMGEPVHKWDPTEVPGCLVRPMDGSDADGEDAGVRPDGVVAQYRVAFPKAYAGPPLVHARVALVERGMDPADADEALLVSGAPDVTRPCPTRWNMTAIVGRARG